MSKFYLEQLLIQGIEKPDAVLDFKPGANFVIGPSNTGKSLIMEAIDYVFGMTPKKKKPFKFNPTWGYTDFTLKLRTENGTVILKRSTEVLKTKVLLSGTDPNYVHGQYSVSGGELNSIYTQLMGIDGTHEIWSSAEGRKNQFTWRNIIHMFFLRQTVITRDISVFLNPDAGFANNTSAMYSLLFLMTGEDADAGKNPDTAANRKAKKEAITAYIHISLKRLEDREKELQARVAESSTPNMPNAIAAVTQEMNAIQEEMSQAIGHSKVLMDDIFNANSQLSGSTVILERFKALKGQYVSDIQRLSFVVEGERIRAATPTHGKCPFCDGDIVIKHNPQYIDASRSELKQIELHLESLETATRDIIARIKKLKEKVASLEAEKERIDNTINADLKPRFDTLKQKLDAYRAFIQMKRELELIEEERERYKGELLANEINPISRAKDHNYKEDFDPMDIKRFETILMEILKKSGFAHHRSARINMDTCDLEIAGQPKSLTNGGGYCGILNTIMALAMMEFLSAYGKYCPGILYADSSLSQLSESEKKARAETIKTQFIQYIALHNRDVQTIIIEHKEKVPVDIITSSGANIIEFTGDVDNGRYGLLPGVRNLLDQE